MCPGRHLFFLSTWSRRTTSKRKPKRIEQNFEQTSQRIHAEKPKLTPIARSTTALKPPHLTLNPTLNSAGDLHYCCISAMRGKLAFEVIEICSKYYYRGSWSAYVNKTESPLLRFITSPVLRVSSELWGINVLCNRIDIFHRVEPNALRIRSILNWYLTRENAGMTRCSILQGISTRAFQIKPSTKYGSIVVHFATS